MKKVPTIARVTDIESQGKRLHNDIYLLPEDAVDLTVAPEIDEANRTMAALTINEGEGWVKLPFVKFTPSDTSEGSGNDITTEVTNTLSGTIGGDAPEIDDFIENQHGRGFYIAVVDRFTQKKRIYGRPYCPYYFQNHSRRKNADNTSCDVSFVSPFFFQPLEYLGSLVSSESDTEQDPGE